MPAPSTSVASPFEPGAVLGGKYKIERKLAEGGIGGIVLATHVDLQQRVAIKHVLPRMLTNTEVVERFRREAKLLAHLHSEHVVRVHDVADAGDAGPYMVMEFLEGENLGAALERGPFAPGFAVECVLEACEALAEAHALGIVHRDLKPENLFLARGPSGDSSVKVLDFGISKLGRRARSALRVEQVTEASDRFGTPAYMSPEQLQSSTAVDVRTDVWALGVVLFELVTGQLPFDGDGVGQIAIRVLTTSAGTMASRGAATSDELEAVVARCLERNPAHRYANVSELSQALQPFASSRTAVNVERVRKILANVQTSIMPPRAVASIRPLPTPTAFDVSQQPVELPPGVLRGNRWQAGLGAAVVLGVAALVAGRSLRTGSVPVDVRGAALVAPGIAVVEERVPLPTAAEKAPVVVDVPDAAAKPAEPASAPKASRRALVPTAKPNVASDDYDTFGGRR